MDLNKVRALAAEILAEVDAAEKTPPPAPPPPPAPLRFRAGEWVTCKIPDGHGGVTESLREKIVDTHPVRGYRIGVVWFRDDEVELAIPPFPTPVWTRDRRDRAWLGPWCSSGRGKSGGILDANGGDWELWTAVEPEECRKDRIEDDKEDDEETGQ